MQFFIKQSLFWAGSLCSDLQTLCNADHAAL